MPDHSTRRDVLAAASALTLGGTLSALADDGAAAARIDPEAVGDGREGIFEVERQPSSVFPQSVASGGPTPSGVLLWTRVDPDARDGATPLGVEVATDPEFADVVYRGTVPPERFGPDRDFTATVDLDGELDADTRYRYRFVYDGDASRVGRCRTLPGADASPESVRFAVASCNDYLDGFFGAFARIAEEDVDFLVHLGDFIYSYGGDGPGDRAIELPSGNRLAHELADYRHLYRTYRSDRSLQRALEAHTLIHTWDDHEIVNDRWWNYETDAPQSGTHPRGEDPEFMRQLYVDAIRAYTEHVPVRVEYEPEGSDRDDRADGRELPADDLHDAFRLYRSFRFGDLAELFVTDERLYRSEPPSAGEDGPAVPAEEAAEDPGRTMLGDDQRRWFLDGTTDSSARWTLWGNEVLASAFRFLDDGSVAVNADAWDGYRTERGRLLSALSEAGVENLVTLTGDMHSYLAAYLLADFAVSPQALASESERERVGVEFMAPAVSSDNLVATGQLPESDAVAGALRIENPHVEWFDSSNWGYAVVEVNREELVYSAYAVDRSVDSADVPKRLLRRYRVPAGEVAMEEVDGGG
ncbi:alkaline phosphatase D family protein (plasmid) [Halorussus salilacus]|uniref:alkaline phosphatase D family protein n=1 Tax=Halorussus salilacus TaxID=2953750 RepID=UPI00209F9A14|nr:alkaline phosphatase D family protein [Halorussus salilacus]USZ69724.1 alkaline phosphatase D family protein [Halorussus salilacus]